jgi:hypothetical protein
MRKYTVQSGESKASSPCLKEASSEGILNLTRTQEKNVLVVIDATTSFLVEAF